VSLPRSATTKPGESRVSSASDRSGAGGKVSEVERRGQRVAEHVTVEVARCVGDSVGRQYHEPRIVHVHERHHDEVVCRIGRRHARGRGRSSPLVTVRERCRVAVVAVSDEYLLVRERCRKPGERIAVGQGPDVTHNSVVVGRGQH
jgi:hypothetical protein